MRSRKDPFSGRRVTAEFMLWAQRGYLQFPVNYRNRERMPVDRGAAVDHTTVCIVGSRPMHPRSTSASARICARSRAYFLDGLLLTERL